VILEAIDIVQLDDGRKIIRHLRQRGVNFFTREAGRDLVKDQIIVARDKFLVRIVESGDRHELPPPSGAFLGLAQHASEDAIEPGADAGWVTELVQPEPRPATRLLHRILGVGPGVGASDGEREQAVEMRQDERLEARVSFSGRGWDWGLGSKGIYCR